MLGRRTASGFVVHVRSSRFCRFTLAPDDCAARPGACRKPPSLA
jgi:hypothetical protein